MARSKESFSRTTKSDFVNSFIRTLEAADIFTNLAIDNLVGYINKLEAEVERLKGAEDDG